MSNCFIAVEGPQVRSLSQFLKDLCEFT